jgi:hypothetical protein
MKAPKSYGGGHWGGGGIRVADTPAANITTEATPYEFRIEIDLAPFSSDKPQINYG